MSRVRQIPYDESRGEVRAEYDRQKARHGRMTNMKRTLAHSWPALRAYMTWYDLYDEVSGFAGERAATIFVHAISTGTDCLICSTFFRRILIEWGEDPDAPRLDSVEALLAEYGRQLARDAHDVSDELYARLAERFDEGQIVSLTALGGMMIATNVFNNALRVDLDEYLEPYRAARPSEARPA